MKSKKVDKTNFIIGVSLLLIFLFLIGFTWDKANYLYWNYPILSILNVTTIFICFIFGLIFLSEEL